MFGCQNTGSAPGLDSLSHDGLTARQSEHELVVDPLTIPAASPSERRRVRVSQRSTTPPPAPSLHLHRRAAIAAARDAARRVRCPRRPRRVESESRAAPAAA